MKRRKNAAQGVTMADVAREAKVSLITVSRVLNNHEYVADQTRETVLRVVQQLGYEPNAIARSLVLKQTRTIGLVTTDLSDYFFAQTISGAEIEARSRGYFSLVASVEGNLETEPQYVKLLTERHVDGLFFLRPSTTLFDDRLVNLLRDRIPIVTVGYHLPIDNVMVVDVDNVDGAQQAVNHLIQHGHEHIAMITGPLTYQAAQDRQRGYELSLAAARLPYEAGLVVESDWNYEGGYAAMERLLARRLPFTALFAQSDEIAIGGLQALREAGYEIPTDVSVVSYNDLPVARYFNPSLTTIRQPMRELGQLAAGLLIDAIQGAFPEKQLHLLRTELIQRTSVTRRRKS